MLLEGFARLVAFLAVAAVVQMTLDFGAGGMRWSMRAALLTVILVVAVWLIWRRLLGPLRLATGSAELAQLVERKYPQLQSVLISAVRFADGQVGDPRSNSPALIASVVRQAASKVGDADFGAVLDPRRAKWSSVTLVVVLVISIVAAIGFPERTGLWFARNVMLEEVALPKRTRLVVELTDGVLIGAIGDDLVVQAHAEGVQPREVEIFYETVKGQRGRESMVTVGSQGAYRYRYTFKNVREEFTFYLQGGDDRTETFQAKLLERPRVEHTEMRITPPDYLGLPPFTLEDGQRAAQVLPGTEVAIWIDTNKPVTSATLMAGKEAVADAVLDGERYRATVMPTQTHTYQFGLVDDVGLENRRPVNFSIRMLKDEPPRARIKLPGVGDMITVEAILPITLEITDTYGLATAELVYQVLGEGSREDLISLPTFKPKMTTFATELTWPVADVDVQAGDRLSLRARATDFDDVSGPNFAQSPEVMLRVVTRDELLAELARREHEYRSDFERLIDRQEQLRGDLLTVMRKQSEGATEPLAAALSPLERKQRNITSSVNVLRQQFEQILTEMRVNQLATSDEESRLGDGIVGAFLRLNREHLVAAGDSIRQWSREGTEEKATGVDAEQVALIKEMRVILDRMVQWEGFHEVVNLLRDIVRLQNQLNAETREAWEQEAGEIFEDQEP